VMAAICHPADERCSGLVRIFPSLEQAKSFRSTYQTGGWIFVGENKDSKGIPAIALFPEGFTPYQILSHPLIAGQSGELT